MMSIKNRLVSLALPPHGRDGLRGLPAAAACIADAPGQAQFERHLEPQLVEPAHVV